MIGIMSCFNPGNSTTFIHGWNCPATIPFKQVLFNHNNYIYIYLRIYFANQQLPGNKNWIPESSQFLPFFLNTLTTPSPTKSQDGDPLSPPTGDPNAPGLGKGPIPQGLVRVIFLSGICVGWNYQLPLDTNDPWNMKVLHPPKNMGYNSRNMGYSNAQLNKITFNR